MSVQRIRFAIARSFVSAAFVLVGVSATPPSSSARAAEPGPDTWSALEKSRWLADGETSAPRVVYVFTDANCPYCSRLWSDARPWVDAGRLQLRHVLVGVLTPTSDGKAATLLSSADPAAALASYETGQRAEANRMIDAGVAHPFAANSLPPLDPIPPAIRASLDANVALMRSLGLHATPAVVFREAGGRIVAREGVRPADEATLFGPR